MYIEPLVFNFLMLTGATVSVVQVIVVLYLALLTKRYFGLKRHLESVRVNDEKKMGEIESFLEKTILKTASSEIEENLKEEMARFVQAVREETVNVQKAARVQVEEAVSKEKEERLKKLGEEMDLIVHKVCEKVLGREISGKEHEQLVFEALEEARKDFENE